MDPPLLRKVQNTGKNTALSKRKIPKNGIFFISSDAEFSCHSEYARSIMHHAFLIGKNHIFRFPNMERPVTVVILQTRAEKLSWTGTSYDS
jgi:hypothetical protein